MNGLGDEGCNNYGLNNRVSGGGPQNEQTRKRASHEPGNNISPRPKRRRKTQEGLVEPWVTDKHQKMATEDSDSEGEFGQRTPPITKFIADILKKYPVGSELKELVQNADDAGAKHVKFLLDTRTNGKTSLIPGEVESFEPFQGPALVAYNDSVFTPKDLKSISEPSRSRKADDPGKTGRFGLGFCSVYHLTDMPSFVSGKYAVILDPHEKRLRGGGRKWNFTKHRLVEEYGDQFGPYKLFGCDMEHEFDGTLFRFPLRSETAASSSHISGVPCTPEYIQGMFERLKSEAPTWLLFLRNVASISLYELSPGDTEERLVFETRISSVAPGPGAATATATATQASLELRRVVTSYVSSFASAPELCRSLLDASEDDLATHCRSCVQLDITTTRFNRPPEYATPETDENTPPNSVNTTTSNIDKATVKSLNKETGTGTNSEAPAGTGSGGEASSVHTDRWVIVEELGAGEASLLGVCEELDRYDSLRFVPYVGVAVRVGGGGIYSTGASPVETGMGTEKFRATTGSLFCSLPLPVATGLPVHVNGYFELTDNRRGLWGGDDLIQAGAGGAGALRASWNKVLLSELLPRVYGRAVEAYARIMCARQQQQQQEQLGASPHDFYSVWPDIGLVSQAFLPSVHATFAALTSKEVLWTACPPPPLASPGEGEVMGGGRLVSVAGGAIFSCSYDKEGRELLSGDGLDLLAEFGVTVVRAPPNVLSGFGVGGADQEGGGGVCRPILLTRSRLRDLLRQIASTEEEGGEFCHRLSASRPLYLDFLNAALSPSPPDPSNPFNAPNPSSGVGMDASGVDVSGLPLLLLADGRVVRFTSSRVEEEEEEVYVVPTLSQLELLRPALSHRLVDVSALSLAAGRVTPTVLTHACCETSRTQVVRLTPGRLAGVLLAGDGGGVIPSMWLGVDEVPWPPTPPTQLSADAADDDGGGGGEGDARNPAWLSAVWNFIFWCARSEELPAEYGVSGADFPSRLLSVLRQFEGIPLLLCRTSGSRHVLRPVAQQQQQQQPPQCVQSTTSVIMPSPSPSLEAELIEILLQLGCALMLPRCGPVDVSDGCGVLGEHFAQPATSLGVLKALEYEGEDAVPKCDQLGGGARRRLRDFLWSAASARWSGVEEGGEGVGGNILLGLLMKLPLCEVGVGGVGGDANGDSGERTVFVTVKPTYSVCPFSIVHILSLGGFPNLVLPRSDLEERALIELGLAPLTVLTAFQRFVLPSLSQLAPSVRVVVLRGVLDRLGLHEVAAELQEIPFVDAGSAGDSGVAEVEVGGGVGGDGGEGGAAGPEAEVGVVAVARRPRDLLDPRVDELSRLYGVHGERGEGGSDPRLFPAAAYSDSFWLPRLGELGLRTVLGCEEVVGRIKLAEELFPTAENRVAAAAAAVAAAASLSLHILEYVSVHAETLMACPSSWGVVTEAARTRRWLPVLPKPAGYALEWYAGSETERATAAVVASVSAGASHESSVVAAAAVPVTVVLGGVERCVEVWPVPAVATEVCVQRDLHLGSASQYVLAHPDSGGGVTSLLQGGELGVGVKTVVAQLLSLVRVFGEREEEEGVEAEGEGRSCVVDAINTHVGCLYQRLEEALVRGEPDVAEFVTAKLRHHPTGVIWMQSYFIGPDKMAHSPIDAGLNTEPYLYSVPDWLSAYPTLLRGLGVKPTFTREEVVGVLDEIEMELGGGALSGQRLQLCLAIARHVVRGGGGGGLDLTSSGSGDGGGEAAASAGVLTIPVPTAEGFLVPSSECLFNDAEFLQEHPDRTLPLLHPELSRQVAEALGVVSLRQHFTPPEESMPWDDFSQFEELTTRLRNLLNEYPDGAGVFKEMVQNADDAGARRVKFCVDRRSHGTTSLLHDTMAKWQGPALLAFNDAQFSESDFKNICSLGKGAKLDQLGKVGRFGVGFNSVYHLTDVPSFVSGNKLAILDPHRTHLPRRGNGGALLRLDDATTLLTFKHQFDPYRGVFGCDFDTPGSEVDGTLFRFPFRSAGCESEICAEAYGEERVQQLVTALRASLPTLLLFLQSVESVEMFEWARGAAQPELKFRVALSGVDEELRSRRCGRLQRAQELVRAHPFEEEGGEGMGGCPTPTPPEPQHYSLNVGISTIEYGGGGGALHSIPKSNSTTVTTTTTSQWRIVSGLGREESLHLACGSAVMRQKKLVPLVEVAAKCVRTEAEDEMGVVSEGVPRSRGSSVGLKAEAVKGYAFCFLPLPITTGLPVHVNAMWALTSNRRNLWSGDDDASSNGMALSDWNSSVLVDALPDMYVRLLRNLVELGWVAPEDYRELWVSPVEQVASMWERLRLPFFRKASQSALLWSEGCGWVSRTDPRVSFIDPSAAWIKSFKVDVVRSILLFLKVPVVWCDADILAVLKECEPDLPLSMMTEVCFFRQHVFPQFEALPEGMRESVIAPLLGQVLLGTCAVLEDLKQLRFVPPLLPDTDGASGSEAPHRLLCPSELIDPSRPSLNSVFAVNEPVRPGGVYRVCESQPNTRIQLERLGMRTSLSWPDVVDRAEEVQRRGDVELAARLLQFVNEKMGEGRGIGETLLQRLREIAWMPVMMRPTGWPRPLKWAADQLRSPQQLPPPPPLPPPSVSPSPPPPSPFPSRDQDGVGLAGDSQVAPLAPPSTLFSGEDHMLVAVVAPVAGDRIDPALGGLMRSPAEMDDAMVATQLRSAIQLWAESPSGDDQEAEECLEHIASAVYRWLGMVVRREESETQQKRRLSRFLGELREPAWVWLSDRRLFVDPSQLSLTPSGGSFEPYLYSLPSDSRVDYGVVKLFGVTPDFTAAQYVSVLHKMVMQGSGCGEDVSSAVVETVKSVLDRLATLWKGVKKTPELLDHVVVPTDSNQLVPAVDAVYCDMPRLSRNLEDDGFHLLSSSISRSVARSLRVRMLSDVARAEVSSTIGEPFGQGEPLEERLKGILREYPFRHGTVLKELLQNADDAEASEMHVLLDCRTHPCDKGSSLLGDKMGPLQGPALCVYNNASLSDHDFAAIQRLGVGGKRDGKAKIGRFGVGLNSCYHYTDCFSLLSSGLLCVFDPLCQYVPNANVANPGRKFTNILRLREDYPDQMTPLDFTCFDGTEQGTLDPDFSGTLFRFPLRGPNHGPRRISDHTWTADAIQAELLEFEKEAAESLLFLRNVRQIKVTVLGAERQEPEVLFEASSAVVREMKEGSLDQFRQVVSSGGEGVDTTYLLTTSVRSGRNSTHDRVQTWLVNQTLGRRSVMNLAQDADRTCPAIPVVGVASPLDRPAESNKSTEESGWDGRAFCFLPLPIITGLPVHLNGFFDLASSRAALRGQSFVDREGGQWNSVLVKNVLAPAYGQFLLEASRLVGDKDVVFQSLRQFYSMFPRLKTAKGAYWELLVKSLYQYIHKERLCVFARTLPLEHRDWVDSGAAVFSDASLASRLLCKLPSLNLVSEAASFVQREIEDSSGGEGERIRLERFCPEFLCHHLRGLAEAENVPGNHRWPIAEIPWPVLNDRVSVRKLLDYCVNFQADKSRSLSLAGVPLLLVRSGELRMFPAQGEEAVFIGLQVTKRLLFPSLSYMVADANEFAVTQQQSWGLSVLTVPHLAKLLQFILPTAWCGKRVVCNWAPGSSGSGEVSEDGTAGNAHPTEDWVEWFWEFCIRDPQLRDARSVHAVQRVCERFSEWPLIPVHPGSRLFSPVHMENLLPKPSVLDRDVATALDQLQFPYLRCAALSRFHGTVSGTHIAKSLHALGDVFGETGEKSANDACEKLDHNRRPGLATYLLGGLRGGSGDDFVGTLPLFPLRDGSTDCGAKECVALVERNSVRTASISAYSSSPPAPVKLKDWIFIEKVVKLPPLPLTKLVQGRVLENPDSVVPDTYSYNPVLRFYDRIGVRKLSPSDLLVQLIFPSFPGLGDEDRLEVMTFVRDNYAALTAIDPTALAIWNQSVKRLAFIKSGDELYSVAAFCNPRDRLLFNILPRHHFPPEPFSNDAAWIDFFSKLGFRQDYDALLLECARLLSTQDPQVKLAGDLLTRFEESQVKRTADEEQRRALRARLSDIPFIPAFEHPLRSELSPGEAFSPLVALSGAVLRDHADLAWSKAPVLIDLFGDKSHDLLLDYGVTSPPPVELVSRHLLHILSKASSTSLSHPLPSSMELGAPGGCNIRSIVLKIYRHLNNEVEVHGDAIGKVLRGEKVVVLDDGQVEYSSKVYFELAEGLNLGGQGLWAVPSSLKRYYDFLNAVGVRQKPEVADLVALLTDIGEACGESVLEANELKCVVAAVTELARLLKQSDNSCPPPVDVTQVLLPDASLCLVPCPDLVVCDSELLRRRLGGVGGHRFLLGTLSSSEIRLADVFNMPTLSSLVSERVTLDGVEELDPDEGTRELEDTVTSLEFSQAVTRLYLHAKHSADTGTGAGAGTGGGALPPRLESLLMKLRRVRVVRVRVLNTEFVDVEGRRIECGGDSQDGEELEPQQTRMCVGDLDAGVLRVVSSGTSPEVFYSHVAKELLRMLEGILSEASCLVAVVGSPKEKIHALLDGLDIGRSGTEEEAEIPCLGAPVLNAHKPFLTQDFHAVQFKLGEYVAMEGQEEEEENVFRYAKVVEVTGEGCLVKFRLQVSEEEATAEVITVPGVYVYKFCRRAYENGSAVDVSGLQAVPVGEVPAEATEVGADEGGQEPEGGGAQDGHRSLPEKLQGVHDLLGKMFDEISDAKERDRAFKRLYLRWHPDKNRDDEADATVVFRYVKEARNQNQVPPIPSEEAQSCAAQPDPDEGEAEAEAEEEGAYARWDQYAQYESWNRARQSRSSTVKDPLLAAKWLQQAASNLGEARVMLREGYFARACFLSHQVAEAGLKAALYASVGVRDAQLRSHGLLPAAESLAAPGDGVKSVDVREHVKLLEDYYLHTRYPNCHQPAVAPCEVYSAKKAGAAVNSASTAFDALAAFSEQK